ncbi:MAG: hypothetical protein OEZ13_07660 [Spirochaetia bacterium]|nr:hypothetical protein [Spirochaetia bacterium]
MKRYRHFSLSKLFFMMSAFLILAIWYGAKAANSNLLLTIDEKKAIKREMIDMDIDIRNLASMISMQNAFETRRIFFLGTSIKVLQMPKYQENMKRVIEKLRGRGLLQFLTSINLESAKMYNYLNDQLQKKRQIDWDKIQDSYMIILNNCRACHIKTLPDETRE